MRVSPKQIHFYKIDEIAADEVKYFNDHGFHIGFTVDTYEGKVRIM